jgi:hypothetical protein
MPFVYVIQSGHNTVKIGKATNVRKRLRALQTAQPYRLKLLHQVEVTDAGALEKAVHEKLKRSRLQGEWFMVEPGHAIATLEVCADRLRRQKVIAAKRMVNLYCPACFHRGSAPRQPAGCNPFKCSKCGARPLIGGVDPIRPWWEARAAAAP